MKDPQILGKVGIVAVGGGFRGACLPGFFPPLIEHRVPIRYLAGVSIGSLVLSAFSGLSRPDAFDEMEAGLKRVVARFDYIDTVGPKAVFDFKQWKIWNSEALIPDDNALFWLLKDFDPVKSLNSPVRFDVSVFNEQTQTQEVISNHDPRFRGTRPLFTPEDWRKFIVASARIGPFLKSIKIGGDRYYDGGYASLSGALKYGCDTVFVLYPYPETYFRPQTSNSWIERMIAEHFPVVIKLRDQCAAILRDRERAEIERIELRNELVEEITKKDARIKQLQSKLVSLEKELSMEGRPLLEKLWGKLRLIPKMLAETQEDIHRSEYRPCRVIKIWGEPPPTLAVTGFSPGDFREARLRFERASRRAFDNLLK